MRSVSPVPLGSGSRWSAGSGPLEAAFFIDQVTRLAARCIRFHTAVECESHSNLWHLQEPLWFALHSAPTHYLLERDRSSLKPKRRSGQSSQVPAISPAFHLALLLAAHGLPTIGRSPESSWLRRNSGPR
jgi:hypothetical protein